MIFNNDYNTNSISEFISSHYALKKIAVFVDEDENNIEWVTNLEKVLQNKIIENKPLTEDVAFCIVCGNYNFQQDCLKEISQKNIQYGIVVTNLSQSSFILPYLQSESLIKINSPQFISFEKQYIKNQSYSCNLAVISFLQSRMVSVFEKEYYSKIFNKNYTLECKNKLLSICDSINGVSESKYKNIQNANLKILNAVIKYLNLQQKYPFLSESDLISNFSLTLTDNLFKNFYENMFIASVFSTSLLEKYFALTFNNAYTFNYETNLKYCNENFNQNIKDFQNSVVTDNLCYKLQLNKMYFNAELYQIKTKILLKKYDFLSIFSDFGYKLVKILQKTNIKQNFLKVANTNEETLIKQVRNVGLLDF